MAVSFSKIPILTYLTFVTLFATQYTLRSHILSLHEHTLWYNTRAYTLLADLYYHAARSNAYKSLNELLRHWRSGCHILQSINRNLWPVVVGLGTDLTSLLIFLLFFFFGATSSEGSILSKRIRMKLGRNILQVNTHRLMKSDFDVTRLSALTSFHAEKCCQWVLSADCMHSICLAHMQQRPPDFDPCTLVLVHCTKVWILRLLKTCL